MFRYRDAILRESSRTKEYKRVLLGTFVGRLPYTASHPYSVGVKLIIIRCDYDIH